MCLASLWVYLGLAKWTSITKEELDNCWHIPQNEASLPSCPVSFFLFLRHVHKLRNQTLSCDSHLAVCCTLSGRVSLVSEQMWGVCSVCKLRSLQPLPSTTYLTWCERAWCSLLRSTSYFFFLQHHFAEVCEVQLSHGGYIKPSSIL